MSGFGFLEMEDVNLDHFFEDTNVEKGDTPPETITCPYCHKEFIKE